MSDHVRRADLHVAPDLAAFVEDEALAGLAVTPAAFWAGFSALIHDLAPENRALLARRQDLQAQLDVWWRDRRGQPVDVAAQRAFLEEIGYLEPDPAPFRITTAGLDPEVARVAGPQLVCPVNNRRFALNAANARWGSLTAALTGTDALGAPADPAAAARAWIAALLDDAAPLAGASHADVLGYGLTDGALAARLTGRAVALADPASLLGWRGAPEAPEALLLTRHGLRLELTLSPGGALADVVLESALTAIMDFEDSVAAVDSADKVAAYRVWLELIEGRLAVEVRRGAAVQTRRMAGPRVYTARDGGALELPGRTLMLARAVGHLMTTPAVLDRDGREAPEGLLDAALIVAVAARDVTARLNSRTGAIYVVKPKMHGPAEVAFADKTFARVEALLGLPADTVKIGIMDEERRTTLNLPACIAAARSRVMFINTGFLDRTGDEIHSAMQAGPMIRKADMKSARWLQAYEDWNVDVGLACGLGGHAQIGKGMWTAPDAMAGMLAQKIAHPQAGATTAWVPGPQAATLHATHYLRVDVAARHAALAAGGPRASRDDLLAAPLAARADWSPEDVRAEIENNAQGILGYVVRWIDQGVGCSKVPDIHDVGLMEDRATCRISAQHLANWLTHGVVSAAQVEAAFRRMAVKVDGQNAGDPAYRPMAPGFDGPAFKAALALALEGAAQPSGYTEPLLHRWRLTRKALDAAS